MKKILFSICLLAVAACDDGGPSDYYTNKYLSCDPVPNGIINYHTGCPGYSGTWNNYEVKKNPNGAVISIDLYCGGQYNEHPTNQGQYDAGYVGSNETSSADFRNGTDCLSGTRTDNISNILTANIWQRVY